MIAHSLWRSWTGMAKRARAVSEAAEEVCAYPVETLSDYRDLKDRVDAVSIAAPTSLAPCHRARLP
jgi:hypothetical protein